MSAELVPNTISHDVVEALETLLEAAKAGDVTGLAFAAALKRSRYVTNVAGTCHRNPTHARGMVITLSDELGSMIHGRDPEDTR